MDATHIADQVLTASTALAGLLLVFLSNAASSFESYDVPDRGAVRARYRVRGWLAFAAFAAALLAALLDVFFYWDGSACSVTASAALLIASLFLGLIAAFITVRGIG